MRITWDKVKTFITLEKVILLGILLVIWILFSLPTVFFYISNEENGTGWTGSIDGFLQLSEHICNAEIQNSTEPEDCSSQSGNHVSVIANIGQGTVIQSKCYSHQEGTCAHKRVGKCVLPNYPAIQKVLMATQPGIHINCNSVNMISEISQTIDSLVPLLGPQCTNEGLPFLCDYFLPTCVNNTNVHYPTEQQCNYVKTGPCKTEWSIASFLPNLKPILPDCSLMQHSYVYNLTSCITSSPEPTDAAEPSPTSISESSPTNISEPSPTNMSEPSPTNMSEPSSTNMSEPSSTNMSESSSTNMSEPSPTYIANKTSTRATIESSSTDVLEPTPSNNVPKVSPTTIAELSPNSSLLSCHPLFIQNHCICLPSCSKFRMNTEVGQVIEDIIISIALILDILSGIAYFVFFIARLKVMSRFPTILIFYGSLAVFIIGLFVALARIVPDNDLFCSHDDFLSTVLDSPTAFCTISGFIFQFLMLVTFLFWLLHIILVWITVVFPHTANKVKKHGNVIHVTMVIAVIAFSLIGPVVAVAKYPYIIPRLPAFTCFSSDLNWTFYSLILPCSITFALASTFLVLLFRTTYKNQSLFRRGQCLNTPEIKILFISIVYIMAGVFVLVRYGQSISSHGKYVNSLLEFGLCHLNGDHPSCRDHGTVVDETNIALNCISLFLLGLLPLTSLTYAVKSSDIKRLQKCLGLSKKRFSVPRSASNDNTIAKEDTLKAASTTFTNSMQTSELQESIRL